MYNKILILIINNSIKPNTPCNNKLEHMSKCKHKTSTHKFSKLLNVYYANI